MAETLPETPTPDKPSSTEIQPKRIVAGGISALLVFIVNGVYDDADEASLRQLLAPLASVLGLVAGSALAGLYEFCGKLWVTISNNWLEDYNTYQRVERGVRKNIKELRKKLKDKTLPSKEAKEIRDKIKNYEQLIMDNRSRKLTVSPSIETSTTTNNPEP